MAPQVISTNRFTEYSRTADGEIRNVILGIIKAHYNIVKTSLSNVNCGNINAIAMGPLILLMILFISSSDSRTVLFRFIVPIQTNYYLIWLIDIDAYRLLIR